jgi:hypothetical protein
LNTIDRRMEEEGKLDADLNDLPWSEMKEFWISRTKFL